MTSVPTHFRDRRALEVCEAEGVSSREIADTLVLVRQVALSCAEHELEELVVERESVKVRARR